MKDKKRILNNDIKARTIQLINEDGENLGEMHINEARQKAEEQGLDLMEVGKGGVTSIVKILDYGKYLYRQKKQIQKNKQKGKAPELKTVRITFKIGDHDLEIRKKQAEKFAEQGHPLKVSLMLRGRENQYFSVAEEKMQTFIESIGDTYKLDNTIKKSGNVFTAMLKPIR